MSRKEKWIFFILLVNKHKTDFSQHLCISEKNSVAKNVLSADLAIPGLQLGVGWGLAFFRDVDFLGSKGAGMPGTVHHARPACGCGQEASWRCPAHTQMDPLLDSLIWETDADLES